MAPGSHRPSHPSVLRRLSEEGPSRRALCELLDLVSEKLDSERIFLFLLKSSGGFHVPVARNRDRENISNAAQKVSHYAVQRVVEDGKTLFVQEAQKDRRYRVEEDLHGGRRALSVLVLPLKVRGELRGGIYADHRFQTLADRTLDPEVEHLVEIAELSVQMRDQRDLLLQLERSLKTRHAELETPMELAPEGNRRRDATFLPLLEGEGEAEVFHGMLTANPDMRDTFDKVRTLAVADLPVLIYGETGVGKGLLAHAVHVSSKRAGRPFVSLSCSTVPDPLIESELLGHVRGAFTGAEGDREGLLVQASGSTLFLDEVEEMSDALQKKLLRVLADGQVRPLGAKDSVHVDVRIVCAAKERLEDLVQGGRFRQDLYFRLKGVVLEVAPLRERPEDILRLAEHFLDVHSSQDSGVRPELSRDAKLVLLKHAWSGNVRELENEMRRLVALRGEVVRREDLELSTEAPPFSFSLQPGSVSLSEVVNLAEKEAILEALRQAGGNKSRAATQLGITRKALYRRLAKYGISK